MDPNETLKLMNQAVHRNDGYAMRTHAIELIRWLAMGGFQPKWAILEPKTFEIYRSIVQRISLSAKFSTWQRETAP